MEDLKAEKRNEKSLIKFFWAYLIFFLGLNCGKDYWDG